MLNFIELLICLLSFFCFVFMIDCYFNQGSDKLSAHFKFKLFITGIVAFFADTMGVGSYPVNIAICRHYKLFADKELPALVNVAQVVPGALSALIFLKTVSFDTITLVLMCTSACIGGVLGANFVTRINQQKLRLFMIVSFFTAIVVLILSELHYLHIAGDQSKLEGFKLIIGCLLFILAGALTAAGVGIFAMIQIILMLLGMSPLVIFPVMTTVGAIQQPISAYIFIKRASVSMKKIIILSLSGLIGVVLAIPMIKCLNMSQLRCMLIIVLLYNLLSLFWSYIKHQRLVNDKLVSYG